jgi:hypothetical protein
MDNSEFKIAKRDIIRHFDTLPQKIFTQRDISSILDQNRGSWRLPATMTSQEFIALLTEFTRLSKINIRFRQRPEIRFTWSEVPLNMVLLTVKPGAYFSHYSAMFLNNLTRKIPKTVYVNFEQAAKRGPKAGLSQSGIDLAFSRPARVTTNMAEYQDQRICLVNGKFTEQLGVIDGEGPDGEPIRVTNIERTLIDIVVRPTYSGGVAEVLNAYRLAEGRVSINKLCAYLGQLDYVYPYHQAIGFYLERAGVYNESILSLLRRFKMDYDFYLTNQMKDKSYSEEWELYYPKGM